MEKEKRIDFIWNIIFTIVFICVVIYALNFHIPNSLTKGFFLIGFIIILILSYWNGNIIVKKTRGKYPKELNKSRVINLVVQSLIAFILFYLLGFLIKNWFNFN